MLTRICLIFALVVAIPAYSQVDSGADQVSSQTNDSQMMTPPPINGETYPTAVGAEVRSNYLRGGVAFNAGYINNFYAGNGGAPLAETTFSIFPTMALDQTTPRQHTTVSYSPGFTFYQPTSELDEVDENASVAYQFRLTPHSRISANDSFVDSSTVSGLTDTEPDGSVAGSPPTSTPGITPPFARRLTNNAAAEFALQTSRSSMIGASGSTSTLHYPNPAEVTGLYDSSSRDGSAFYNRRLSSNQYLGVTYNYSDTLAYPTNAQSDTQTHAISGFYTIYLMKSFSLSASGGPQHYQVTQTSLPTSASWGPSISASMGWQGMHTSFSAGYSQSVTGGGGLLGAFHTRSANATTRWQMSRTWTVGVGGNYSINKSVTPFLFGGLQGGHTVSGTASLEHSLSSNLRMSFQYLRAHQSYSGIVAISDNPDSDRETISIYWQFMRPLGR